MEGVRSPHLVFTGRVDEARTVGRYIERCGVAEPGFSSGGSTSYLPQARPISRHGIDQGPARATAAEEDLRAVWTPPEHIMLRGRLELRRIDTKPLMERRVPEYGHTWNFLAWRRDRLWSRLGVAVGVGRGVAVGADDGAVAASRARSPDPAAARAASSVALRVTGALVAFGLLPSAPHPPVPTMTTAAAKRPNRHSQIRFMTLDRRPGTRP